MVSASVSHPAEVSGRRLNAISLVLVLGALATLLDSTIVNIAIRHLSVDFAATVARTQWIATAYLLAFVAVIPVSGWASERFGARTTWLVAVGLFMIGSLLCGVAGSLPTLIAFRVLQGVGGGMVLPVTITILTRAAGQARIGRAIATIGFIGQLAPILGPIIGGAILESWSWRWLFLVNVPLCLLALILGPLLLPRDFAQSEDGLDLAGFCLLTPGVVAVAYGVTRASETAGVGAAAVWVPLAIGIALIVLFVWHALRARERALIDVRVFARRSFGLSSVITFLSGFSMYGLMLLLPLFYQGVRGESVLHTGLLLIPQGLGTMAFILLNRSLFAKLDGRLMVGGGVLVMAIGTLPFATAAATGNEVLLLAAQFLQGFGLGASSLPLMTMAFASLTPEETPRGSAAFNIVQRVGAPFGVAVIAVILQNAMTARTGDLTGMIDAFHFTFWWIIALSAIPLVLAAFVPATTRNAASASERS